MAQADSRHPRIFICYRRGDSGGHAHYLFERLNSHFGDGQVFMDLEQIEPGEDFVQVIEEAVGACEILLALVGPHWLAGRGEKESRLDDPADFVRLEIASALARGVSVIPVLVQGAQMPRPHELPEEVRPFTRRQAFEFSDRRWRPDADRLVERLERVLAQRRQEHEEESRREAGARRREEEEERLKRAAAEEERRRREAEEERRRRETGEAERHRREAEGPAHTMPAAVGVLPRRPLLPTLLSWPDRNLGLGAHIAVYVAFLLFGIGVMWVVWRARTAGEQTTPNATQVQNVNAGVGGIAEQKADPPQAPERMAYVPGGEFRMGNDAGDEFERPVHTVTVKPFFIDLTEVPCADYEEFVQTGGARVARGRKASSCPQNAPLRPVTGVTWENADAFCRDRGKRLPTEAEWEFAARGTDGRRYPWGNEWRARAANADGAFDRVMDIGAYQAGKSPFSAYDMVGNVWEWTDTDLAPYPGGKLPAGVPANAKVIRGGSFAENWTQATATYRGYLAPDSPNNEKTGFRCARDVPAAQGQ